MTSDQLDKIIASYQEGFDRKTLAHPSTDPFIFVTIISTHQIIHQETRTFFLSEGNEVHHPALPQQCLACSMHLAAELINDIPRNSASIRKGNIHMIMKALKTGEILIVVAISDKWDDSEWCARRLVNQLEAVNSKPA